MEIDGDQNGDRRMAKKKRKKEKRPARARRRPLIALIRRRRRDAHHRRSASRISLRRFCANQWPTLRVDFDSIDLSLSLSPLDVDDAIVTADQRNPRRSHRRIRSAPIRKARLRMRRGAASRKDSFIFFNAQLIRLSNCTDRRTQ